jgi:hypothetical protein
MILFLSSPALDLAEWVAGKGFGVWGHRFVQWLMNRSFAPTSQVESLVVANRFFGNELPSLNKLFELCMRYDRDRIASCGSLANAGVI